jgi:hypothetical protein
MGALREAAMNEILSRKTRIEEGEINSIPITFDRFKNDYVGLEQSTYYAITSFTKGGKTQIASYLFVFKPLLYAYLNKNVQLTILYFNIEETKLRIMQRMMCWLLYEVSNGKIRISPRDLRSSSNDKPCPKEIIDYLNSPKIVDILNFMEANIIFSEEESSVGIYKCCKEYAESVGTAYYETKQYKDELGNIREYNSFKEYTLNNPNHYIVPFIDTINLMSSDKEGSIKKAADKLSEYAAKYMRNRYKMSPVIVQQQAFEQEGNEAFKLGRLRPSAAGLGDTKYTSRDANVLLGIFAPFRFGLPEYLGYDISILKDNIRFLEVILNRDGEMGGIIGLYFDGAVSHFEELPTPDNKEALQQIYKKINPNYGKTKTKSFFSLSLGKRKNN